MIDGIKGVFDKGSVDQRPEYVWPEGKIIISTDPVAGDSCGLKLINKEMGKRGLALIGDPGKELDYLLAADNMGLGTNNSNVINLNI